MNFTALTAVGTLVFTLLNLISYIVGYFWGAETVDETVDKEVKAGYASSIWKQLAAWAAGIAGIAVAAHTQFAADVKFGSLTLATMDFPTQVFIGLIATSILSTANEFKKAIDNTDTSYKPPWFGKDRMPEIKNRLKGTGG